MIFLGGSCNPTTWRQTVAIPYLELQGISYYNPQVDNWTPDVVDVEKQAKRNAEVLLFVIDRQTRSTVSLVESAFMAGYGRNLVLVIYPFEYSIIKDPSQKYTCTTTNIMQQTDCRYEASSRTVNRCEIESASAKKSSSSMVASATVISALTEKKEQRKGGCLKTMAASVSVTSAEVSLMNENEELRNGEKLHEKTYQEAKQTSSNVIRINGEDISLIELLELEQARLMLQALARARDIPLFSDIDQALKHICTNQSDSALTKGTTSIGIEATNKSKQESVPSPARRSSTIHANCTTDQNNLSAHIDHTNDHIDDRDSLTVKDVYLSLDSDDQSDTKSRVIPLLKERGLKYNFLYINDTKDMSSKVHSNETTNLASYLVESGAKCAERLLVSPTSATATATNDPVRRRPTEATDSGSFPQKYVELIKDTCAVRSCRIFLFVITNRCRGLPIMVLASHFMALFQQNVVLCIQHLEEPCTIAGETLTSSAIADYNRSRIYLKDYAMEFKVPTFTNIREAIDCCSHKCSYNNSHSH